MLENTRFLGLFGRNKAQQVGDDITKFVVGLDPATASQTELDMLQSHLNEIDGKLAQAEQAQVRAAKESAAAQATVDQYIKASDILSAQIEAGKADAKSLDTLLATVEKAVATLDSAKQEEAAAAAFTAQLAESHKMMAEKLGAARGQLKDAVRELEQAKLQKERSEERARDAQMAAGLTASGGKLNIALDAITAKADQAKADARAAELTASALKPTSALDGDPAIAAALAAAAQPEKAMSTADRLEALRNRAKG